MSERQKFGLHVCVLDSHCRRWSGWCWRIEMNTPWWHLGIALRPDDRYVRMVSREPIEAEPMWISFQRH